MSFTILYTSHFEWKTFVTTKKPHPVLGVFSTVEEMAKDLNHRINMEIERLKDVQEELKNSPAAYFKLKNPV